MLFFLSSSVIGWVLHPLEHWRVLGIRPARVVGGDRGRIARG